MFTLRAYTSLFYVSPNALVWLIGNVAVAFLYYKSIGPLFSSSDNFIMEPQSYDNYEEERSVISSIISVSISSNPPKLYELEKITFTLSHLKVSCFFGDYWLWSWFRELNISCCVTLNTCEFLNLIIQIQN